MWIACAVRSRIAFGFDADGLMQINFLGAKLDTLPHSHIHRYRFVNLEIH